MAFMALLSRTYGGTGRSERMENEGQFTDNFISASTHRRGFCRLNVSEYSGEHEIDSPYPLKYECVTFHVALTALEDLCDPRFVPGSNEFIEHARELPPPFTRVAHIRTSKQLGTLSLDDFAGKPHLTLVRYPNEIIFKPLNGGPTSILDLRPFPDFAQDVCNFLFSLPT